MAQLHHRIFAFFMAGLFFFSACAFSAFVIYDMIKTKKDAPAANASQQAQATPPTPPPNPNALQGKPLADFTPVDSVTELQKIDTKEGDGAEATATDTITVDYTGAVASTGVVFQSSKDTGQPAELSLDQVIPGWKEGIPGMKVGGTRRLIIPADKAYGANPPQGSGIPANAPLVFDVTLVKIGK
jgi:FKBP-type peptidyl-prolyl cis-trans isomerase